MAAEAKAPAGYEAGQEAIGRDKGKTLKVGPDKKMELKMQRKSGASEGPKCTRIVSKDTMATFHEACLPCKAPFHWLHKAGKYLKDGYNLDAFKKGKYVDLKDKNGKKIDPFTQCTGNCMICNKSGCNIFCR